jgi:hypothetical protein
MNKKAFIFTVLYVAAGHPNDPRTESFELPVHVSSFTLGEAVQELQKNSAISEIREVENAKAGAIHRFKMRF